MSKKLKYSIVQQMKIYDSLGFNWMPFVMFSQKANIRSAVINTDSRGFRFNSKNQINNENSIFANKKKISLILGGSFVFGVGSSFDEFTVPGYLSNDNHEYLNLGCRAYVGIQEIISLILNINKIHKIENIVIVSGLNDLYQKNLFSSFYPDTFYFYSNFIKNMYFDNLSIRKKIFFKIANKFFPKLVNFENIQNLNYSNLPKIFFSKKFQKKFKNLKNKKTNFSFEEKIDRNFKIYNLLSTFFNCKVQFYLQPTLRWSKKQLSSEENILLNLNKNSDEVVFRFLYSFFKKKNMHQDFSFLLKKYADKYSIDYFDINLHLKSILKKKDWIFIDDLHCTDMGYKLVSDFIKSNI